MAGSAPHLQISDYRAGGYAERCLLTTGSASGSAPQTILLVPPLFDEANKLRRLMTRMMILLAQNHGIAALLPDLPGTLESERALSAMDLEQWREALTAVIDRHGPVTHCAALRAGCSIAALSSPLPQWHLAPITAWQQLRTLARAQLVSERETGAATRSQDAILDDILTNGGHLVGYDISAALANNLLTAANNDVQAAHIVQLARDDKAADSHITGTPLWLRTEPDKDEAMAAAMADSIANWAAQ